MGMESQPVTLYQASGCPYICCALNIFLLVLCRPEWQRLALQQNESEADHTARMKEAGLRFCSRVVGPRDSVAEVLQNLLSIPAAEAAAIAHDAGRTDASAGEASQDGCSDAIPEGPVAATGTVGSEARSASPERSSGKVMEGSAIVQATGPSAHPSLPIGFSISAYIESDPRPNRHDKIRTALSAHCPKHDRAGHFRTWHQLRIYLNKHAKCRCAVHPLDLCSRITCARNVLLS